MGEIIVLYLLHQNQIHMSKDFFNFGYFEELKVGDVFKFSPTLDDHIPSKFYTVYEKNENTTNFNSTYGKSLNRIKIPNNYKREVMIFPNRKR